MQTATFRSQRLTVLACTPTAKAHRWDLAMVMGFQRAGESVPEVKLGDLTMTVTATDQAAAEAIAQRCLDHFTATGRVPNVPEQTDPDTAGRPSRIESIRSLRLMTGESIASCTVAWDRRDEPAFGGDPVLSLVMLTAESAGNAPDANWMAWAREHAAKRRRDEPELDRLFPLAA